MSFRLRPSARVLSVGLVAIAFAGAFAWSLARAAHASPAPVVAFNDAIKKAMDQINDSMKTLSKGVTAENRDASLAELAKLETAVIAAKAETPESAAKVDEKKRAAFVADFKKTLVETLKFAADAETAILDAKYKDADTIIRNKLGGMKSTGHGKFKPEGK